MIVYTPSPRSYSSPPIADSVSADKPCCPPNRTSRNAVVIVASGSIIPSTPSDRGARITSENIVRAYATVGTATAPTACGPGARKRRRRRAVIVSPRRRWASRLHTAPPPPHHRRGCSCKGGLFLTNSMRHLLLGTYAFPAVCRVRLVPGVSGGQQSRRR